MFKNDMVADFARWSGWRFASATAFAAVCGFIVFSALTRGSWDWDVVGYTIAVLADGRADATILHANTWAMVKDRVPAAAFADLTLGTYRQAVYASPAALVGQLPLYENKLGYILLLRLLSPIADPIEAMRAVSLASGVGILLILFRASWAIRDVATLAWLPFVALFGISGLASMSSPDPLAIFLYTAVFAALLDDRFILASLLALLAVFIRPEGVVSNVILSVVIALRSPRVACALFLSSVAVCVVNLKLSSYVGWWAQFHFNFIGKTPDLTKIPDFDLRTYFSVLIKHIQELAHLQWFQVAIGMVILTLAMLGRTREPFAGLLVVAILASAAARFLLYPSIEMRHHGSFQLGLALIILHALRSLPPRDSAG